MSETSPRTELPADRIEPTAEFDPDSEGAGGAGSKDGAEGAESPEHIRLGRLGEKIACRYLFRRGFRIVARNVRGRRGEIDIIAEKRERLHFVEVKTRSSSVLGPPEERVDAMKREILREAAREYLEGFREQPRAGVEFDVLAIVLDERGKVVRRTLIEGAF